MILELKSQQLQKYKQALQWQSLQFLIQLKFFQHKINMELQYQSCRLESVSTPNQVVKGHFKAIKVHFLPNFDIKIPVIAQESRAPIPKSELIQLPSSLVNDLDKVQLLKFGLKLLDLSLQSDRNGSAGDVHAKTIPKLNAPIVAEILSWFIKIFVIDNT